MSTFSSHFKPDKNPDSQQINSGWSVLDPEVRDSIATYNENSLMHSFNKVSISWVRDSGRHWETERSISKLLPSKTHT